MTPEERETLIGYVAEVKKIVAAYALRYAWLKALLAKKDIITADEVERAVRMVEAAFAVEEALDHRVEALDRLGRWNRKQE